jgi:hypothetical protein
LLEHGPEHFDFLKRTRLHIDGVDDLAEWKLLRVSVLQATQLELSHDARMLYA